MNYEFRRGKPTGEDGKDKKELVKILKELVVKIGEFIFMILFIVGIVLFFELIFWVMGTLAEAIDCTFVEFLKSQWEFIKTLRIW